MVVDRSIGVQVGNDNVQNNYFFSGSTVRDGWQTEAPTVGEAPLEARWRAGEEGWLGGRRYLLLHDGDGLLGEERDATGQRVVRALARQTEPEPAANRLYAWLRQGDAGLTREHGLLKSALAATPGRRGGRRPHGMPEIIQHDSADGRVTLALSWPADGRLPCQTLRARFAPGSLHDWQVHLLLNGLRGISYPLERLHRMGHAHRNLTREGIVIVGNDGFRLRDLGLAATGLRPGEGPADYQAPEQAYGSPLPAIDGASLGQAIDVYQLAAIAYHLITGRLPVSTGHLPPPSHQALPDAAADTIAGILAADAADRPRLPELRAALADHAR